MLLLAVVSLPGLFALVASGGPLEAANLDRLDRVGALFLGQAGLTLCVFVMVPVLVAKKLVLAHERDPISAHGKFRPELAVFRVGWAVLGTSAFLALFFTLVHGRLIAAGAEPRVGTHTALFVALAVQLLVPGVVAAEGARRLIGGPWALPRAAGLRAAGAVPFVLLFPAFVWLPVLARDHSAKTLGSIGHAVDSGLAALEPGVALVRAALERDVSWALGWLTLLATGLLGSGWVLVRWLDLTPMALGCPEGRPAPAGDLATLPLAPRAERRRSALALFLWKDVFVERARRPVAYLGLCALLLAGTCLLGTEFRGDLVVAAASAGLGMPSLGAVGREGPAIALLRLIFRPTRIFVLKWAVGWTEAAAHIPVHVLALTAVAAEGTPTSASRLLVLGLASTGSFSLLGTGLGFLVPDSTRRSFLLPGSSRAGQVIYLSLSIPLLAFLG
jgi:hypothetical protein